MHELITASCAAATHGAVGESPRLSARCHLRVDGDFPRLLCAPARHWLRLHNKNVVCAAGGRSRAISVLDLRVRALAEQYFALGIQYVCPVDSRAVLGGDAGARPLPSALYFGGARGIHSRIAIS